MIVGLLILFAALGAALGACAYLLIGLLTWAGMAVIGVTLQGDEWWEWLILLPAVVLYWPGVWKCQ